MFLRSRGLTSRASEPHRWPIGAFRLKARTDIQARPSADPERSRRTESSSFSKKYWAGRAGPRRPISQSASKSGTKCGQGLETGVAAVEPIIPSRKESFGDFAFDGRPVLDTALPFVGGNSPIRLRHLCRAPRSDRLRGSVCMLRRGFALDLHGRLEIDRTEEEAEDDGRRICRHLGDCLTLFSALGRPPR